MQASITLYDLGLLVLFVIVAVAGGYAVVTLKNINATAKEVVAILRRYRKDLDQGIPNIAQTTDNALEISKEVKKRVYEAGKAIETISRDTTDTVLRVNETADQVANYALVIGEVVKTVRDFFPSGKRA